MSQELLNSSVGRTFLEATTSPITLAEIITLPIEVKQLVFIVNHNIDGSKEWSGFSQKSLDRSREKIANGRSTHYEFRLLGQ